MREFVALAVARGGSAFGLLRQAMFQVVCCPGRDKGPGMTQTQTKLSKVMPSLS